MQRLIGTALAIVVALGLMAVALTSSVHKPQATALAADDAGPWSLHPAPTPASPSSPLSSPALANATRAAPLTLTRDETGQFHLTAEVNGRPMRFLVDTGADMIALTQADAEQAGIAPRPAEFRPAIRSASGTGMGAQIMLDRLSVGPTAMDHVPALVVMGLEQNLLGQTALRQMGRVELNGDVMTITPN